MKQIYTKEEMKKRAIRRCADVLFGQWEEGSGVNTRIFEVLVPDEFVTEGVSLKGNDHREHVVPLVVIRDQAMVMFDKGASVADVSNMIEKYLRIVNISAEEANYLDHDLGLKERMPDGWEFGSGDPLARLKAANIELA